MKDPNRHTPLAQLEGTPRRHYYDGRKLEHAIAIGDLRAMTHRRLPRFALEYLEAGSEDEATLARERQAYAEWRFTPRVLVDVARRNLEARFFGRPASMPVIVAPTGLNAVFWPHADTALAQAAAKAGIPFTQSTMSNDPMEAVAKVPNLRHWWQLYVFGEDEVWRTLLGRADRCGCEALVVTVNAQIFGNREWSRRTHATQKRLSLGSVVNAACHPGWLIPTILLRGMPAFCNAIEFVPEQDRSFFDSAYWIRNAMPKSLSWDTIGKIRELWRKPMLIKGLLHPQDVERAVSAGVDGIVLSSHGGRQLDWTVAGLDMLPEARRIVGDRLTLLVSGGIRRGTDILKALALGADGVMIGRAALYGVAAAGAAGALRALEILREETDRSLGLLGAPGLDALDASLLRPAQPSVGGLVN